MSFNMKTAIRILLLVAKIMSDDEWRVEIQNLSNHINAGDWRSEKKSA